MNRLLAAPVIAAALLTATSCASNDVGAPAPTTPASAPASAAPPAPAASGSAPAPASEPAAEPASAPAQEQEQGGYATFPIGPGKHIVLLHSYDASAHTAVVEPAAINDSDGPPVLKGEGSEYTLPVDTTIKVFSVGGGNPDCMAGEGTQISGTCPADSDWLQQQIQGSDGFGVEIANTEDHIYQFAELYLP